MADSSIYFEALKAISTPFSDLAFFTDASRPLVVNVDSRTVLSIRISLDGAGALKLTGLDLRRPPFRGQGGATGGADSAALRTSDRPDEVSHVKLSETTLGDAQDLVCVERTTDPWVILELDEPIELLQIAVWTRELPRQARAPLVMEISPDGATWETVYSTSDRLAAQAQLWDVISRNLSSVVDDLYSWSVFSESLALLFRGQRREAEKHFKGSALSKELMMEMREAITRHLLEPMHMEWNHHGVRRTFRFWTKQEKVRYIKTANLFISELREHVSPHVCLGFGSVLSLVRDQDLIPHDDDLDIIIAFDRSECPTLTEGFKRLVDFAERRGYTVRGHNSKSHRQFIRKGTKKVDVFVGLREGDRVSWFPQKRGSLSMSDVFPPISAKLLGVECQIPANPIRYLESVYGPRWSKPDPAFSHSWRTTAYDDIL